MEPQPQQQRELVRQPLGTRPVNHRDVNTVANASVQPQKNQYVSSSSNRVGTHRTPNHHHHQQQQRINYNHHQMQYGNAMTMMMMAGHYPQQYQGQTSVRGNNTTTVPFKSPTTLNFERILGAGK